MVEQFENNYVSKYRNEYSDRHFYRIDPTAWNPIQEDSEPPWWMQVLYAIGGAVLFILLISIGLLL